MDSSRFEEAGLYDPNAPDAAERLELLTFLESLGVPATEMKRADRERGLVALAVDRFIYPEPLRWTLADISHQCGLPMELLERLLRSSGLAIPEPEARVFSDRDVEVFRQIAMVIAQLGEDVAMNMGRTIGSALARIAEGVLASYESAVGTPLRASGASELELARTGAAIGSMVPMLMQLIDAQLRHHLQAARRRRWESELSPDQDTLRLTIGFGDLVGSTRWSRSLTTEALAKAIATFEAMTTDLVVANGGRPVKIIGDEILFVAVDPHDGARIAAALIEAFHDHAVLPPIRVGVALGDVIAQDGDYYGPVVNLAARAVKEAGPGDIVVSDDLATALGDGVCTSIGKRMLKGFAEPVELFRYQSR